MRDRQKEILQAACRMIGRKGLKGLRIEDIAAEVDVSPTLVYYYFGPRANVVQRALELASSRTTINNMSRVDFKASGIDQLRQILLFQFEDSPLCRENWIIWTEVSANALSDSELRSVAENWVTRWAVILSDLFRRGQADGSVADDLDVEAAATRLTSLSHSLGTKWVLGSLASHEARTLALGAIERELRVGSTAS